jgi:hypothetical protein
LSLDSRYGGFVAGAISLIALVGTSVVGSLITLQEEEGHSVAAHLGRVTVIAAVAIFCASLLAYSLYWLVPADFSLPSFLPSVRCGRFFMACVARYGGDATSRLMTDGT